MTTETRIRFNPGTIVATPAAIDRMSRNYMVAALRMHLCGNWGTVDADDKAANDRALRDGGRLLSAYPLPDEAGDFWVLTESDRSVTTILLPSDY